MSDDNKPDDDDKPMPGGQLLVAPVARATLADILAAIPESDPADLLEQAKALEDEADELADTAESKYREANYRRLKGLLTLLDSKPASGDDVMGWYEEVGERLGLKTDTIRKYLRAAELLRDWASLQIEQVTKVLGYSWREVVLPSATRLDPDRPRRKRKENADAIGNAVPNAAVLGAPAHGEATIVDVVASPDQQSADEEAQTFLDLAIMAMRKAQNHDLLWGLGRIQQALQDAGKEANETKKKKVSEARQERIGAVQAKLAVTSVEGWTWTDEVRSWPRKPPATICPKDKKKGQHDWAELRSVASDVELETLTPTACLRCEAHWAKAEDDPLGTAGGPGLSA